MSAPANVYRLARELNVAILEAIEAGFEVDVGVVTVRELGPHGVHQVVAAKVSQVVPEDTD